MDNSVNQAPQILKETKNGIKVDFERTSKIDRMKIKYLNGSYFGLLIWRIFRFLLLVGVSYVILYPFFSKIAASFMSAEDFVDVTVKLIPKYPTLDTFKALFNTALISLFCAVLQTFMSCVIGYGFAKFKFRGSGLLFACVIFTMIVPHSTVQLSMFMKFKYYDIFGIIELLGIGKGFIELTNTYWPLAILSFGGLAFKNGLYIFLMRQFFKGVPDELEESAYIDGSGIFRTFLTIILPLSGPMLITVFMFAFSWQWTDEFYTGMFFTKTKTYLLPNLVGQTPKSLDTQYAGQSLYEAAIQNTIGLMIISPLLILYLIFQRHLVQGIERSGITG